LLEPLNQSIDPRRRFRRFRWHQFSQSHQVLGSHVERAR